MLPSLYFQRLIFGTASSASSIRHLLLRVLASELYLRVAAKVVYPVYASQGKAKYRNAFHATRSGRFGIS